MTSDNLKENKSVDELIYSNETAKIKSVVLDMISKLQVVLCFPLLSEMSDTELRELSLSEQEILSIKRLLKKSSTKVLTDIVNDDMSEPSLSDGIDQQINEYTINFTRNMRRENEELCRLIYPLLNNKQVTQYCKERLQPMLSEKAYNLIYQMQQLLEIILGKLQQPPDVVEQNEIELHQMYEYSDKHDDRFHTANVEHMLQSKANKEVLKKCDLKLKAIEERISEVQKTRDDIMVKCMTEADYKMNWDWKLSEFRQEAREEKVKNIEASLEKLKKENIIAEKELRVKRYKVEQQLKAIVTKYDADMEDRQIQYDEVLDAYQKEEAALLDFSHKYYEQQTIYDQLMKEKRDYEKKIWEERLYAIQCKIAARKIQRFFRAFLFLVKEYGNIKKKKK